MGISFWHCWQNFWDIKIFYSRESCVSCFLGKNEKFDYVTDLRSFLVNHPLLVLEMGFHPIGAKTLSYGFDVEETVPRDL